MRSIVFAILFAYTYLLSSSQPTHRDTHPPSETCSHIHTYAHMHIYTHRPRYTHKRTQRHIYTYKHAYTHIHTHAHAHANTNTQVQTQTHPHTLIYTNVHTCKHSYTHKHPDSQTYTHWHTDKYRHTHTYLYIYIYIYIYIYDWSIFKSYCHQGHLNSCLLHHNALSDEFSNLQQQQQQQSYKPWSKVVNISFQWKKLFSTWYSVSGLVHRYNICQSICVCYFVHVCVSVNKHCIRSKL